MIRFISISFFIGIVSSLCAQNAYDFDHTLKFGQYLYNTSQFELAAQEFERAVFYEPKDSISNFMLFKTYSILNQTDKALSVYKRYSHDAPLSEMPQQYGSLYSGLLIKNGMYDDCMDFVKHNCCLLDRQRYVVSVLMAQAKWEDAWTEAEKLNLNNPAISPLLQLVDKSKNTKYRKPFIGALFSAVLPGSGKLYAGNWEDAVIGFLMTSASGFVAYRAYDKYGVKNGYTWFSGILALGYYSGNVYGGYNAVKKYNLKKENELVDETKRYISDF